MGLENLRSVFQENIEKLAETFSSNRPQDRNDSKFVFNDVISQTHTFGVTTQEPILDTLLRGRIYQPGSFNPTLIDKALFVEPETPPFINQNFKNETYDPRVPKNEGIQINNTGFQLNQDFNHFATAGLDGAPFTPLSELGISFYNGNANNANNLSWQRLYTSEHRAKNNPSWQGISAVNYGPNVNRDKLDIRDSKSNSSFFSPSRNSIIDNLSEPYIISKIGDNGRTQNAGNRSIPIMRALTDTERISKFLASPAGLSFIAKENIYSTIQIPVVGHQPKNSSVTSGLKSMFEKEGDTGGGLRRVQQRFGVTYNPLQTLFSVGGRIVGQGLPNVLFKRSGLDLGLDTLDDKLGVNTFFLPQEYGVKSTRDGFNIHDEAFTNTGESFGDKLGDAIGNAFSSLNPFSSGAKVSSTNNGDIATLTSTDFNNIDELGNISFVENQTNNVSDNGSDSLMGASAAAEAATNLRNKLTNNSGFEYKTESMKYGMPLYFKDMRDGSLIFFRAYVEGLTENVSPSWNATNYIGRSEPVYTYERAERDLTFTLKLVAQTKREFSAIYKKMNRLTSLCYPHYQNDEYGNRMKPPLAKFRYGEMYGSNNKELLGFIKSVSYSVDQSSTYEVDGNLRAPRHISATISYQVIHGVVPSLKKLQGDVEKEYSFYGINNLRDDFA